MKTKEIKNPDSPMGRKEYEVQRPRWRLSLHLEDLLIIKECMETYFNKYPETRITPEYSKLYDYIVGCSQQMQTPLMVVKEENPLF